MVRLSWRTIEQLEQAVVVERARGERIDDAVARLGAAEATLIAEEQALGALEEALERMVHSDGPLAGGVG
jgi:hypothetical protein